MDIKGIRKELMNWVINNYEPITDDGSAILLKAIEGCNMVSFYENSTVLCNKYKHISQEEHNGIVHQACKLIDAAIENFEKKNNHGEYIIQKIIDNADKIVGIKIDGDFYDVDYVSVDDVDCYDQLSNNDVIVNAHSIDNCCGSYVMTFEFTVAELKSAKEIKLYKLEEI